jgi:hypothetical protein
LATAELFERVPRAEEARYANMILGVWLFLTAFAWRHAPAAWANTWIVGLLVVAVAIWGLTYPGLWRLNALLGLWLIVAALVFPHLLAASRWNNAVVGVLIAVVSGIAWATGDKEHLPAHRRS